jgi:5-dehydro-2-deoxygluconokinase
MNARDSHLDILAIGRSSVDLYGEQIGGRLEDMASFAKYVGGSPTNTAIGCARLGLRAALLTRVGQDHFGRFIRETLEREHVDAASVIADRDRLTALAILGIRDRDTFPLLFYRENCADMALQPDDVDAAQIQAAAAVLVSGTHLSKPNVFETSRKAMRLAKDAGRKIVFDIDYRPVLWGLTALDMGENRFVTSPEVTKRLQLVAADCDLVVGTEEEFQILGGTQDTLEALRHVRAHSNAILVCKRGPEGCAIFADSIGDTFASSIECPGFPVEVFNVLGAGDAFMAGFLRGWLRGAPLETCGRYGNACGAIVVSRHGCAPAMPYWTELQYFLDRSPRPYRLREDAELEHIHWAASRPRTYPELMVLAADHRSQFVEIAEEFQVAEERIDDFKTLCLAALDRVAKGDPRFGILLDGRFGSHALAKAAGTNYWVGRPIEIPGSRPLAFEASPDVACTLREWPLGQVVKCLVRYHPDDDEDLKALQEKQLERLADACRSTRHELLLEVIASGSGPADARSLSRVISRFYDIGLKPDWWKLEPISDIRGWAGIQDLIVQRDPHCRGVVLLGLSASTEHLLKSFRSVARFDLVKGFAVGRTIFREPARQWFSGAISDETAIASLAHNLQVLVKGWHDAKASVKAAPAVS